MITSMEIRNQRFNKSFRGYSRDEVMNFMSQMAQEFENVYSDNANLKEQLQRVEYELQKYKKLEDTMNNSLILAQRTAEDLKINARKEADIILAESKRQINELLIVYQEIIKRLNIYNAEITAQVNGELEMLQKNRQKVESLSNFFYSEDMKNVMHNLEKMQLKETPDV